LVSAQGRIPAPARSSPLVSPAPTAPDRNIRALFWSLAIVLGLLQVWAHRYEVAPDGISYIEIARAGGKDFINDYWSPLYPFLLNLVFRIFPTSLFWESTVVHLVDLAIFLFDLGCFEIFLRELFRARDASPDFQSGEALFSARNAWIAGYVFFLWAGRFWVTPVWVTPDLLVAALVFLATAALLRVPCGAATSLTFASLGAVLGLAYLAKTPMFLLAFVFLACAAWLASSRRVVNVSIAVLFFLGIAAPFVFLLSAAKGRLTFGDSGKINYAEFVNGAPKYVHWQGQPPGTGVPAHPTRLILSDPPLYEFATPIQGSYSPWYDPSYWYEGIQPHFSVKGQLLALYRTASAYLRIVSVTGVLYAVFLGVVILKKGGKFRIAKFRGRAWLVWFPAYAALAMYALVHVEARFLGGFLLMLLLYFLARVRFSPSAGKLWAPKVAYGIILAPAVAVVCSAAVDVPRIIASRSCEQWQVAQQLQKMRIPSSSDVGYIGTGLDAYWAHLAQVRIVAEVPDSGRASFVQASAEQKGTVLRTFAKFGVAAVLTKFPDVASSSESWQQIPETRYFVCLLPAQPEPDKRTN
jgi:hypothetical protein